MLGTVTKKLVCSTIRLKLFQTVKNIVSQNLFLIVYFLKTNLTNRFNWFMISLQKDNEQQDTKNMKYNFYIINEPIGQPKASKRL